VREVQAPCYTNKSCICKRCTLRRASKPRGQIPSLLSAAKKLQRALSQFATPGFSKNDRSAARIAGLQSTERERERERVLELGSAKISICRGEWNNLRINKRLINDRQYPGISFCCLTLKLHKYIHIATQRRRNKTRLFTKGIEKVMSSPREQANRNRDQL
jgi:hypothetical protein